MEMPLVTRSEGSEGDYLAVKSLKEAKLVFWTETVNLWRIAGLVALYSLFLYLKNSSTAIYAGHLGDVELASISVYTGVMFSFYFALLFGMSTALGTLCGQAYGAGQFQSLGLYLQRSWIVLTVTCIILLPLYVFATPILKLLGQEKDIADLAGKYSIQVIPFMFSFAINLPTQRFLLAQSKVKVIVYIAFLALLIQNLLLYIFVYVLRWGIAGAATANNVSGWVATVALVVYAVGWCKEGWNGLSWLAFRGIWPFAKLTLASSVMICLEQWYVIYTTLLAGQLENPVIAVGSYSICASQVISGVAIGSGWQVMVGYINLACYYIVGLPLGILLGFKADLGVKGLWGGTLCGSILQIVFLILMIGKTNWIKEVEQTATRVRIWSSHNTQKDKMVNNK